MDNNLKPFRFGSTIGYEVKQKQMKDNIFRILEEDYRIDLSKECGKYFSSIKDRHIAVLEREPHLCTFNIKGSAPVFMYLTTYAGISFCFYVTYDQIISVKHNFSKDLYQKDTLFEGEIAGDHYLISDLLVKDGERTDRLFFSEKLEILNNMIDKQHIPDVILDCYQIQVKDFVDYSKMESFWTSYRNDLSYKKLINGVIFRPVGNGALNIVYLIGTKGSWKPPGKYSNEHKKGKILKKIDHVKNPKVCFKMYRTNKPDVYHLYLNDGSSERYYHYASIPDKETSQKVIEFFNTGKYLHRYIIVNCQYDDEFKRWVPYRKSCRGSPDDMLGLTWQMKENP